MDKNRVAGKVKDIAGRAERQAGEWTGNTNLQIHGAAKQAEGKIQNAVGKIKDASKTVAERNPEDADTQEVDTVPDSRRS